MYGTIQRAGYVALLVTPLALLVAALGDPTGVSAGRLSVEGGLFLAAGLTAVVEREYIGGQLAASEFTHRDGLDVAAVVAGAVGTYAMSVHAGLGPVLASAAIGLVAGVALPDIDVPVYCGSFVGMVSPSVLPTVEHLAVAAVVAGLAFVAATESFGGFGGKLGTLALFGCLAAVALPGVTFGTGAPIQWGRASLFVPVAAVAAVATVVLSVRFDLGAVVGSALVGLVAGVAFPALSPAAGGTLAAVAFCASFVGMSSPDRLTTGHVGLAGGLCGLVFVLVSPAFVGAGGKLGTIAFVSCLTVAGVTELRDTLASRTPL
ncbi:hypothetical protein [Halorientalis salina]|uniref:hypothetical protein n=1 Tax=Halorientalis salina TaxID=2932266 RepID=UPI0010AC43D3|nr:hypothetical protein [Halorientalis salina]